MDRYFPQKKINYTVFLLFLYNYYSKFMKKIFTTLFFVMSTLACLADGGKDDPKYLAGAVPEVDGKIVFTKELSIPGMPKAEIYKRVANWLNSKLTATKSSESKLLVNNSEEGTLEASVKDQIVFHSSALSLDKTDVFYALTVTTESGQCKVTIQHIRYIYNNGKERYTAKEMISDEIALNKSKTKIVIGLAKWRRKTIDYVDNLVTDLAEALSQTTQVAISEPTVKEPATQTVNAPQKVESKPAAVRQEPEEKPQSSKQEQQPLLGNPVLSKQKEETVVSKESIKEEKTEPATVSIVGQPNEKKGQMKWTEVAPSKLSTTLIDPTKGTIAISVKGSGYGTVTIIAKGGGSIDKSQGKTLMMITLTAEQPHQTMDGAKTYTVRFYPEGSDEATVEVKCNKLFAPSATQGQPRLYVGEITKAKVRK